MFRSVEVPTNAPETGAMVSNANTVWPSARAANGPAGRADVRTSTSTATSNPIALRIDAPPSIGRAECTAGLSIRFDRHDGAHPRVDEALEQILAGSQDPAGTARRGGMSARRDERGQGIDTWSRHGRHKVAGEQVENGHESAAERRHRGEWSPGLDRTPSRWPPCPAGVRR